MLSCAVWSVSGACAFPLYRTIYAYRVYSNLHLYLYLIPVPVPVPGARRVDFMMCAAPPKVRAAKPN